MKEEMREEVEEEVVVCGSKEARRHTHRYLFNYHVLSVCVYLSRFIQ